MDSMTNLAIYAVISRLLAALLLAAGSLKAHELITTEPTNGPRWLLASVAVVELLFGLWLLVGLYPRWSRIVALGGFVGFLNVALLQALDGKPSCGCYGRVPVQPWIAVLVDSLAVGML